MFIQTEDTPNPQTLKFIPGEQVMENGTATFANEADAARSPLAKALFDIADVRTVFYGSDFITVTKNPAVEWGLIKPAILMAIMEHFVQKKPLFTGEVGINNGTASSEEDSELVAQIKELIETRVRPAVAQDGGDIVFHSFEEGIVKLELHGACAGCPSSTATLKQGIESMLKYYVPEVIAVEAVA